MPVSHEVHRVERIVERADQFLERVRRRE